jgi:hypothetical protein
MKIPLRIVIPVVDVCHGCCGDGAVCAVDAVTARQHHNSTATPHRVMPLVSSKHPGSFHTNENDLWLLDDGKAGRSNFHITEDPLKRRFSRQRSLVDTQNVHAQGLFTNPNRIYRKPVASTASLTRFL